MITMMARRTAVLLVSVAAKTAGFLKNNSVLQPAPQHHLVMQRVADRSRARQRALGTGR